MITPAVLLYHPPYFINIIILKSSAEVSSQIIYSR